MQFSIIVAYKNREKKRVKFFLDSLQTQQNKDFELIFVNQGSDEEVNEWLVPTVEKYAFALYIYNCTQGYLWNKSNALNIGIKAAKGKHIVITDIDIIFPPDFIKKITELIKPGYFLTHSAFYLPKSFKLNEPESLFLLNKSNTFHENFIGLCVVDKEAFLRIRGYDEYYLVWGAEDDDIIRRLENFGEKRLHISASVVNIFHQWHETNAPPYLSYWYLNLLNYLNLESSNLKLVNKEFGYLTKASDRSILTKLNDLGSFQKLGILNHKLFQFALFYEEFIKMATGVFGQFELETSVNVDLPRGRKQKLIDILNTILVKRNSVYKIETKKLVIPIITRENWYDFVVFFIGKNRGYLKDYYLLKTDKKLVFYFQKR